MTPPAAATSARGRGRIGRRLSLGLLAFVLLGVVGTAVTLYAQGYRVWVVHTGSMEPNYMPGDIVVDRPPSGHYHRGEVLTFRHSDLTTDVVSHRVTDVTSAGIIHTKGDANRSDDVWNIRPDQVQGSVMFKVKALGYLVVFLQQPSGIGVIACLFFAIVLLWQLFFPPETPETTETTEAPEAPETTAGAAPTDTEPIGTAVTELATV